MSGAGLVIYLLLLVGLAFIPAHIASGKGYSYGGFYAFGFFLFVPALIVALVLEDKTAAYEREESLRKEISRLRQDVTSQTSGDGYREGLDRERIEPICRQCGHENGAGAKFCTKCGAQLALAPMPEDPVCPKCHAKITAGSEFCGHCGWSLAEKEPQAVLVTAVNGEVHCPVCGAAQQPDRTACFKCGAKFEYRQ